MIQAGQCGFEVRRLHCCNQPINGEQQTQVGNNFKKRPELTAPNVQNQFQQSFDIVDMSNIHGKHVHSVKT